MLFTPGNMKANIADPNKQLNSAHQGSRGRSSLVKMIQCG